MAIPGRIGNNLPISEIFLDVPIKLSLNDYLIGEAGGVKALLSTHLLLKKTYAGFQKTLTNASSDVAYLLFFKYKKLHPSIFVRDIDT